MEAPSPADIIVLRQALAVALGRADEAAADAANARAINADLEARIALQALQIEVLKRDRFGQRSERSRRLIDQFELALEAAEATASEDKAATAPAGPNLNASGLPHPNTNAAKRLRAVVLHRRRLLVRYARTCTLKYFGSLRRLDRSDLEAGKTAPGFPDRLFAEMT